MRWTKEQLYKHPKRDQLLGRTPHKTPPPSPEQTPPPPQPAPPELPLVPPPPTEPAKAPPMHPVEAELQCLTFTVPGAPVGKPRMTQRDKWKKRPVVLRYRDYCDRLREASGTIPDNVFRLEIEAHIPMPDSWSKRKKAEMVGKPHQQRPDWDNIGKAVSDALLEEDSVIWDARVLKYWCLAGEERTEIRLFSGF